jgi:hypothetical protein
MVEHREHGAEHDQEDDADRGGNNEIKHDEIAFLIEIVPNDDLVAAW